MSFMRMSSAVSHLLPRVYEHRFNQKLVTGTLPRNTFRFYIEQDFLYLSDFAKALRVISHRLIMETHAREFEKFSGQVVEAQQSLHGEYLREAQSFQLFQSIKTPVKKIPIISDYTNHLLLGANHSPIEIAVASLIPCFWLYSELGKKMLAEPNYNRNNPYHLWISSYSNKEFISSTESIIKIAEELSNSISCPVMKESMVSAMVSAFVKSTEYEILFLDDVCKEMDKSNEFTDATEYHSQASLSGKTKEVGFFNLT